MCVLWDGMETLTDSGMSLVADVKGSCSRIELLADFLSLSSG